MGAFLPGFFLSLSLIAAIGAQNAFVLRQGIQGAHVFAVCLTCAASDAVLVTAGVAGFGSLVAAIPWVETVFALAGAAFLLAYGARSFWNACLRPAALAASGADSRGLRGTIAACLAFTWLNPHVYLDTVVLLGSVSTQYGDRRFVFGLGAVLASFLFFFALGFGARLLAPLFAVHATWRILDVLIGILMTALGFKLLAGIL